MKVSLGRNSFECPSGLWPPWSGSLQTCPRVTPVLGQTSCELSPKLPSDSFWEPTAARGYSHSVIQTCVKHLPISNPVQDAKNMRILRTHNQVENTDMLAGSYRVVKIHRKMKHQTIPGKGVIQEIESEGLKLWSQLEVILPSGGRISATKNCWAQKC